MESQEKIERGYRIYVIPPGPNPVRVWTFQFEPGPIPQGYVDNDPEKVPDAAKAIATETSGGVVTQWEVKPDDPELSIEDFEETIRRRIREQPG
jgi:hypothetical protein